jgi:PTS system ascorbate-specific IIA component
VTGIILISYGNIASELLHAASHILAEPFAKVECIPIYDSTDTIDRLPAQIEETITRLDCTQYLILIDLPGSTHFNVARGFARLGNVAILTGLNLPMLLRVITHREDDLDELLQYSSDGAIQGILSFNPDTDTDTDTDTRTERKA